MSSKMEGSLTHKVNYHYCCHFLAWNLFSSLKELDSLPSQGQGDVRIFKIACFSYVCCSNKPEEHVPYGELVGTECIIQPRC